MKTWTSKLVSGILMALLLVLLIQEKSFAQFQMGNTLAPLTGNSYPIIFTNDSKGGHHQVATIADRDNITTLRRQPGMLCTVMDDGNGKTKTYQLICADVKAERDNNANWVVFASTGSNSTTPSGNSWLYGTADPLAANGNLGDFYLNTTNNTVFGPKKPDNTWPVLQLQGSPTGVAGGDLSGLYPNPAIAEKAISTVKIADGAVTTEKLAVDAIVTEKIKDGAVSSGKIVDGAVTTVKLGEKAVTTMNIADRAVGTEQLKTGLADQVLVTNTAGTSVVWMNKSDFLSAVDDVTLTGAGTAANPFKVKDLGILTSHLAEGAVTEAKLSADAVTTLKVKNAAVTEEKLADDAVSSIKIKDGSVTETKLIDGAITEGKLAAGAVSGDKVKDGAITEIKLVDGAVTGPKIATSAVTTEKLAVDAVVTEKIKDGAVSTAKIVDGAVTTAKLGEKAVTTMNIADQAVGTEQLKTGLADQVLVTNTAGTSVVWINKSDFLSAVDDVTLTGAGTAANPFKVKDLGILTSHLAEGAVTEAKLSADAVTTLKVKNAAVTEEKLADDAVSSIKIKDGSVTETKLIDGAITEGKLAAGAVSGDKVKDGAITEIKLIDGAVTGPKIATGAVTTDKLAIEAVTTEKIKDGAVSTEKIADASITTAKLGDKAVATINIADQAVGTEQLKAGLADQVLVTNSAGTSVVWINKSDFLSAVDDVTLTGAGTVVNPFKVKDLGILTSHLAEGAVTEAKLSADAVTTLKIKNAAVTEEKLADDAVSSIKIKDGAVTETKLVDGGVTTGKIADGAITTAKLGDKAVGSANIADNSITPFKMQAGGANMVLVTDPSGASVIWVDKSALASVVDMETIIGNGTVGDAFQVKDTGIITRKIADLAVTTEKIADQAVSTIKLGDKAITTEKIANKAVTVAQIKEGAANQILTTNAEGTVAWADNTGGTETPTTFNGSRAITGDYYKGVNPNTNDIAKWLEAVFYPSTVPTVSIVPTPSLGTREMASSGANTVSLKWTATRVAGTAEIKQVTVDGVVVSTTSPAENASITGTTTGTITNNTTKSFTVAATTTDGKTASASTSVTFQWKIYYGFITGGDDGIAFNPTDAQIIALSGSDFGTSKALKKQVTPSGSQKLVIAYPSSWGDAAILAGVNDSTGAFDKTTRSFTNASGGTTSYLIYVQKDNTAAGYQVTVQ